MRIAKTGRMKHSAPERLNVSFLIPQQVSVLIVNKINFGFPVDLDSDVLIEEIHDQLTPGSNETVANLDTAFNPDKCPLGELLCMSGSTCIRFEQLCDGTRDCADGADETDCGKPSGTE